MVPKPTSRVVIGALVLIPTLPFASTLIFSLPLVLNNKLLAPVAVIFKFPALLKIGVLIETLVTNAPLVIVPVPVLILLLLVVIVVQVMAPELIDPVVLKLPDPISSLSLGLPLPIPTLPPFRIVNLSVP